MIYVFVRVGYEVDVGCCCLSSMEEEMRRMKGGEKRDKCLRQDACFYVVSESENEEGK